MGIMWAAGAARTLIGPRHGSHMSTGESPPPFGPGSPYRVIGHRGAAAVAPENTLPGFRHAAEIGADGVELDVQCTRDGRLAVIHDPTVDRTTDGAGRVDEMSLEELRDLDAGHRFSPGPGEGFPFRGRGVQVPTLDEVVDVVGELGLVIEVKSARAGVALGEWLDDAPDELLERTVVGGFERDEVFPASARARWRCAYQNELLPYVLLGKVGLSRLVRPSADAAVVPEKRHGIRIVSRGFCRRAHRDGLGVFVWTVNRPHDIRRLLDWGADGLVSDAPGRVRRIVDERVAAGETG